MIMQIEHLALWVQDLEAMKDFYLNYFDVVSGPKNIRMPTTQFAAYFIYFGEGKTRLELMTRPEIQAFDRQKGVYGMGLAHFAISVGGKEKGECFDGAVEKG